MHRVQVRSTGFPGAPGFTSFHFSWTDAADTEPQFQAVRDWLSSAARLFPLTWTGQLEPNGQVIDPASGELIEFTTVPTPLASAQSGIASSGFGAGVAGLVIGLNTGSVNRGRKVRGRVFLVPLAAEMYEANGTIVAAQLAIATEGGQGLISELVGYSVWSRPRDGVGGMLALVTSVRVNDKAAFLSSRRD